MENRIPPVVRLAIVAPLAVIAVSWMLLLSIQTPTDRPIAIALGLVWAIAGAIVAIVARALWPRWRDRRDRERRRDR